MDTIACVVVEWVMSLICVLKLTIRIVFPSETEKHFRNESVETRRRPMGRAEEKLYRIKNVQKETFEK